MVDFGILLAHKRGQCGGDCFVCRSERKKDMGSLEDLDRLDKQFETSEAAKGGVDFTPIPADTKVKLFIKSQKAAIVGGNQTPVCKITCEVAEPAQYARKKIWHDLWLTEANLKYLKRDLTTLGWMLPDGKLRPNYKLTQLLNPNDMSLLLLGAEVTVGVEPYAVVDQETGVESPRVKNTIKFFNAPYKYTPPKDGGAPDTASPPDAPPTRSDDAIPF